MSQFFTWWMNKTVFFAHPPSKTFPFFMSGWMGNNYMFL